MVQELVCVIDGIGGQLLDLRGLTRYEISGGRRSRSGVAVGPAGIVRVQFRLYAVGAQMSESPLPQPSAGIGDVTEVVSLFTGILKKPWELPGTPGEMVVKELTDEMRDLLQDHRSGKGTGLAQQGGQIMLQLQRPVALAGQTLMHRHLLPVMDHDKAVTVV